MTLGGLALAVGVLVDEATVVIENIHTRFAAGLSRARAVLEASQQTTTARLLSMLCVLAVFLPVVLHDRRRPAAVRAAVAGRRVCDDRVVPALQHAGAGDVDLDAATGPRCEPRVLRDGCGRHTDAASKRLLRLRWVARRRRTSSAAAVLIVAAAAADRHGDLSARSSRDSFSCACVRRPGTRLERTELIALKAMDVIKRRSGRTTWRSRPASSACSRRAIRSTRSICSPAASTRRCSAWR